MKILIIRFSSIGDIVLTTPVIRCVKQQVQDAEVHFLTKKSYGSILESNPYIDKVILLDQSWDLMMHELKAENYDYIIDLHHNLRTLKVKRGLKAAKHYSFHKLNVEKWLMTTLKVNRLPSVHIVDRYLDTVKELGVVNDGKGLDFFIPSKDEVRLADIPASHHFGYIAVVIGAALATKKLPVHRLQQLCRKIDYPVMLLGGKEDMVEAEKIAAVDGIKIYNACGKFNLNESADLIRKSHAVITHDTGLMHIAAALRKKIISVWGNTIPAFGMGPYYGDASVKHIVSEVNHLRCRPCSKIGYKSCPKKHFKCMELQNIEAIATMELPSLLQ
ncbi:MAG: glycosyltransferase family 9 protein [Bacteroidota bacterium]|nr:glycosyltransferase family 9 protein [Bacteroidota bacterium]